MQEAVQELETIQEDSARKELDFYDAAIVEAQKENDMISDAEEGFMIGYLGA